MEAAHPYFHKAMPKPANLISYWVSAWPLTLITYFDSVVPVMAMQLVIVSVITADPGVAYLLIIQFKMRSVLQLWLWITFYFWDDVWRENKRVVNDVKHSEHVSKERSNVSQLTTHTVLFTVPQTLKDCASWLCSP